MARGWSSVMDVVVAAVAIAMIFFLLWDIFETIVLPRRVTRHIRVTRLVYKATWWPWSGLARTMRSAERRENLLSMYGPLSLLVLLFVWATGLVLGFAALQWSGGSALHSPTGHTGFPTDVYMSGTTFFTLGLGDVTPLTPLARALTVVEAGTGFGVLALVIGYLPVLYQAFSRREVAISLLDARAGSPPSAAEFLRRHMRDYGVEALLAQLRDWELWAAELMESQLSYPQLGYFRSQHDRQSWVAALTTVLDACALIMVGVDGVPSQQARLTFAMARHAAVDLSQVAGTAPDAHGHERLSVEALARLRAMLEQAGAPLREGEMADARLAELRALYEPYVWSLAHRLLMDLPPWLPEAEEVDAWRSSPWETSAVGTPCATEDPLHIA